MGRMENRENIEVFLLKEDAFSLQVLSNQALVLLNGLRFAIDLLEYNLDEVHLAVGQGFHLLQSFAETGFRRRHLQTLNYFFVALVLFFLKLFLHRLRVKELERVRHKFEAAVRLNYHRTHGRGLRKVALAESERVEESVVVASERQMRKLGFAWERVSVTGRDGFVLLGCS